MDSGIWCTVENSFILEGRDEAFRFEDRRKSFKYNCFVIEEWFKIADESISVRWKCDFCQFTRSVCGLLRCKRHRHHCVSLRFYRWIYCHHCCRHNLQIWIHRHFHSLLCHHIHLSSSDRRFLSWMCRVAGRNLVHRHVCCCHRISWVRIIRDSRTVIERERLQS